MSYDTPNATLRREQFAGEAGGGKDTQYCKFRTFQKARLKKVHFAVTTAGVTDAHNFKIYSGDTAVSTCTIGTNTAGAVISSALLDSTIAANGLVSVYSDDDTTGKAHVVYEYEVLYDATQS